jgi:phage shock protein PspC (stress-responsive transcriptional regulator)
MDTTEQPTTTPEPESPKRLVRTTGDRVLGGVCGGLGRFFGIDPILFRIGAIALVFLGGAGLVVYLAAWLLVPSDADAEAGAAAGAGGAGRSLGRDRTVAVALVVLVAIAAAMLFSGFGFFLAGAVVPLAILGLAGLGVWWLTSGERPAGAAGDVARRALLGMLVLVVCGLLAVASFWASATGAGVAVAVIVIATGAALVAGAFAGRVRWMILPALAVALPLAFVAAADIDLRGGVGERRYHPVSASDLRDRYRLGAGELVVDLRDLDLSPRGERLTLDLGIGHALLLVKEDVCVISEAKVGMGAVDVLGRESAGLDVDWDDQRNAPKGTPRLFVTADVGIGAFEVRHREPDGFGFERRRFGRDRFFEEGPLEPDACLGETGA